MTTGIVIALISMLFLGPLLWRARRDRLEDRALALQADIQAAVNRTVEIFVPAGWDSLLEDVWPVVLKRVPSGYALVFRPSQAPPRHVDPPVRRAA